MFTYFQLANLSYNMKHMISMRWTQIQVEVVATFPMILELIHEYLIYYQSAGTHIIKRS